MGDNLNDSASDSSDDDITDDDVCFGDAKHPGTKQWRKAVRLVAKKNKDEQYSPEIYKLIQKKMKGVTFYIQEDGNDGEWKEAPKTEVVKQCRKAYEKARSKLMQDEDFTETTTSGMDGESYPPSPSPRGRKSSTSSRGGSKRKLRASSPGVAVQLSPGHRNRKSVSGESVTNTKFVFVATGVKSSQDTKVGITLARRPPQEGSSEDVMVLSSISETSIFAGQGLLAGMVVTKINNVPVKTLEESSNIIRYFVGTMTIEAVSYETQNVVDDSVQSVTATPVTQHPPQPIQQPYQQVQEYKYDMESGQQKPQSDGKTETDTSSESNKKTRLIIIILFVVLIIVIIGVGVGVAVAVTSKDKDSEEENALVQPVGNSGDSQSTGPPPTINPPPVSPNPAPVSPPTIGEAPVSVPINPPPVSAPTNPPPVSPPTSSGQDIMELVTGTWAGIASSCMLASEEGDFELGRTVLFAWVCPNSKVAGISLHGEQGDPHTTLAFAGQLLEKGDGYALYDIALSDTDTEEVYQGFQFDIVYVPPESGNEEYLASFYLAGDSCQVPLLREDLSEIGTFDDFC